jgi:hypothetical protein
MDLLVLNIKINKLYKKLHEDNKTHLNRYYLGDYNNLEDEPPIVYYSDE